MSEDKRTFWEKYDALEQRKAERRWSDKLREAAKAEEGTEVLTMADLNFLYSIGVKW